MITRKKKVCKSCSKENYMFGNGKCQNCYNMDLAKKTAKKARSNPKKRKRTDRAALIKKCDKVFSIYIRLRDTDRNGQGFCISSGKFITYWTCDAGHCIGRRNMAVRWDEQNVNAQSRFDNRFNEGNKIGYFRGLEKKFGQGTYESLEIRSMKTAKWNAIQLRALYDYVRNEALKLLEEKDWDNSLIENVSKILNRKA